MKTYNYMGRKHKVFSFSAFGQRHEAIITQESYSHNDTLALQVMELVGDGEGRFLEPWGMLTVNLEGGMAYQQSGTRAYVKNYSENEGWAERLADRIGTWQGISASLGHALVPLYEFDLSRLYA